MKVNYAPLRQLSGYIASALIDAESGMVLSKDEAAPFNIELASALNAEVLKSKRSAVEALQLGDDVEDILITLGKQYHLIRPVENNPQLFLYLAIDRKRGSLAMARMALKEVEQSIAA
ncbi:MAG: roadblock/LC7 domain-containing protein [Pseudomonadota bacterium]